MSCPATLRNIDGLCLRLCIASHQLPPMFLKHKQLKANVSITQDALSEHCFTMYVTEALYLSRGSVRVVAFPTDKLLLMLQTKNVHNLASKRQPKEAEGCDVNQEVNLFTCFGAPVCHVFIACVASSAAVCTERKELLFLCHPQKTLEERFFPLLKLRTQNPLHTLVIAGEETRTEQNSAEPPFLFGVHTLLSEELKKQMIFNSSLIFRSALHKLPTVVSRLGGAGGCSGHVDLALLDLLTCFGRHPFDLLLRLQVEHHIPQLFLQLCDIPVLISCHLLQSPPLLLKLCL
ncbi:hypothetical protein DNTS_015538 [Danionella cerebrum]|uniref:Uncharacterized protein n=1 Tax=Danionella cerebrum TaxID=2873325 RepID=A0A553MLB8_9TELE|nr:hypothetical protein DNTS_015538 [Danionella translucida]